MKLRGGQVALYLIMTIVVLFTLVMMNTDIFLAIRSKNRLQNGGDAAALAAAKVQGRLLNEIGRLNFEHIRAALEDDYSKCDEIVLSQRRMALLGPVQGLVEADKAARENGMEEDESFTRILEDHVRTVKTVYALGTDADGEPYPEPFEGAWSDYAFTIEQAIKNGLAAGPDNMEFYDDARGHPLLDRDFYFAIEARDWCWFHFNCEGLLKSYSSHSDWGELPGRRENSFDNSEIFSLHVMTRQLALTDVFTPEEIVGLVNRYGDGDEVTLEEIRRSSVITNREQVWFFYDQCAWQQWFNENLTLIGDDSGYSFPIVGEIRPEYNVRGCAAICRCRNTAESVMEGKSNTFNWSAAAKPFGKVTDAEGDVKTVTGERRFITPSFERTRLVPLDAVGGEDLATADEDWVYHVRKHLGEYMATGKTVYSCQYCADLRIWDRQSFRRTGVRWLKYHSKECVRPGTYPSGHGGTSHGH